MYIFINYLPQTSGSGKLKVMKSASVLFCNATSFLLSLSQKYIPFGSAVRGGTFFMDFGQYPEPLLEMISKM